MTDVVSPDLEPLNPQRELFDIPEDVAYLNAAYLAPALHEVREAGRWAMERTAHPWEIRAGDFFDDVEELRRLFAAVVSGDPEGVAIVPSASYGLGVAAANVEVAAGDRIVVLAEQFPSNVYVWRELAAARGAEVVTVPRPTEGPWTGAVIAALDDRTAVVALPNCHWTDGTAVDLSAVAEAARRVGAALVLDLTQSLGVARFDVAEVAPDFVVAAAYKWLLGPYGIGFLWVADKHRGGHPLEQGWANRAGSEDFAGLVDYRDEFQPGARRFDVGERSNFVIAPMAIAALRRVTDWRPERVAATLTVHTARIEEETRRLGLDPVPASARLGHMLGVRLPGGVPDGLVEALGRARVHVSVRGTSIRVAPHVWTTPADIDRFLDVLSATVG